MPRVLVEENPQASGRIFSRKPPGMVRLESTGLHPIIEEVGPKTLRKGTINILVVEDDPIHLKLAKLVLSAAGFYVRDAEAAEQAFQAISQQKPDVILLDLALPGMDGITLVRSLKADPGTREIPVIAVTSYENRFGEKIALAAGCEAYLVKPIDTRRLPQLVHAVAESRLL